MGTMETSTCHSTLQKPSKYLFALNCSCGCSITILRPGTLTRHAYYWFLNCFEDNNLTIINHCQNNCLKFIFTKEQLRNQFKGIWVKCKFIFSRVNTKSVNCNSENKTTVQILADSVLAFSRYASVKTY